MNKPQAEGRVNHVCTVEHEKIQHSSAIKKQSSTISNVKSFLLMLNWIIKGQQQRHWLIKWDYIHLCCLTYLIIAGLRHILSFN